ncbi:asparagine synthase (glutamine-hydrolyzing) [Bdellovibrionota bacterium FG-2]
MCGIVGFVGQENSELIRKMNGSQIHRGPDEEGYFASRYHPVTFAMRRLSILDIAGGHQPMETSDGRFCIVYNGEIFNAPELREELLREGVKFQTDHSDTETILQMYATYGQSVVHRLNGMFAFVIYDRDRQILFGARDRFGIKPFYYTQCHGRFAFASELKSLLEIPWVEKRLSPQAVYDYFSFQSIPAPQSIFQGISKLPAATQFELKLMTMELNLQRYWRPQFSSRVALPAEELPGLVLRNLTSAVKRWTLSDVPIACSLSGGIDSSAIVGILANAGFVGLSTFSLGFKGASADLDETHLARLVAQKWGTRHHEIIIDPEDLLSDLDSMIVALDEPYGGGLPSWFVFKAMAKKVKVALTGTGGDELFGNYGKWLPYFYRRNRLKRLFRNIGDGHHPLDSIKYPQGYFYHIYYRDYFKRTRMFSEAFLQQPIRSSEGLIEEYWYGSGEQDVRNIIPSIDLQIQLPDEFLQMTDRFSMAHSLEARTPFLDHEFADFVFQIPAHLRTDPKILKNLLISAVSSLLPEELLSSKKRGFVLPIDDWLKNRLRESVSYYLSPAYLRKQGIFRDEVGERLFSSYLGGRKELSERIWTFYMFQLWYEKNVERKELIA